MREEAEPKRKNPPQGLAPPRGLGFKALLGLPLLRRPATSLWLRCSGRGLRACPPQQLLQPPLRLPLLVAMAAKARGAQAAVLAV